MWSFASYNAEVIGGKFDATYNASSEKYDLDAAYEVRPIVVQTQGRMVEVGVYTDKSCTQHPTQSWLRLSSSSNYTDAYNNAKEPLDTYIKASTMMNILMTERGTFLIPVQMLRKENDPYILK